MNALIGFRFNVPSSMWWPEHRCYRPNDIQILTICVTKGQNHTAASGNDLRFDRRKDKDSSESLETPHKVVHRLVF